MTKYLVTVIIMLVSGCVLWGQETWVKTFGGSESDVSYSNTTTPDGGVVLTGYSSSNDGDFTGVNIGGNDIFVVKLDSRGDIQWKRMFGGSIDEWGHSISTTTDGGFVLTGWTTSNDGDFKEMNKGYKDFFVIKLDSIGDVQWKKMFGGSYSEEGHSITTTTDGGYVLTGRTTSNDGDFRGMDKGDNDTFVIKLDSIGDIQWKKVFGGSGIDQGYSITTSTYGGFVLTGLTTSNDGDFRGMNKGSGDTFVVQLDSIGDIQWKKVFGGSGYDQGYSIATTPDGGFVLTGKTSSNDGDFIGMNKGGNDIFIIKLGSRGDVQWKKMFGGRDYEEGHSITTTSDGGYVLTGYTYSDRGDNVVFAIKLDSSGDIQWKNIFGESDVEGAGTITTTPDGGHVLTGWTGSTDGVFNGMNKGRVDIFIIKLDSKGNLNP
jgi:TfoX/Sxy family transcriptional regulator of competence genes